ncbi:GNAT family N-acetyltransferase [Halosimplex halobium]|uniref:GNAT family N-acetyltransferase n=1 Tax=Halosimplex halobium TaxID=3396618 RepID=UPI003F55890F
MTSSTRYSVDLLDDTGCDSRWTEFVAAHDHATPYHTLAWKQAIKETFSYDPAYRLVTDAEGSVVGAIPGFKLPETVGTSLKNPFCEYGFPLVASGVDPREVLEAVGGNVGGTRVAIIKDCPFSGVAGYSAAGYGGVETGITHRLDVSVEFDRLLEDVFDDSLRRTVDRKGEVDAIIEQSDDVAAYYPVYVETMQRLGSPQFPAGFFESLRDAFGADFHYYTATIDGETVGGLIVLTGGDGRYILSNAAVRQSGAPSYNALLYASAVEKACETDCRVIDFGRSEPGSGVDQFKSQFGGTTFRLVSFVTPSRHVGRADVSGYKRLAPITRMLSPVITHPAVGPELKRRIHE